MELACDLIKQQLYTQKIDLLESFQMPFPRLPMTNSSENGGQNPPPQRGASGWIAQRRTA